MRVKRRPRLLAPPVSLATKMASKKSCLRIALMLYLCLFCDGLKLSPPYDLHWTINEACVHISWKHSHGDEPIDGYYLSVQVVNAQNEMQAPDFVHVAKGVRSTDLQGLWPDATYKVKVVAFASDHHAESSLVTIQTNGLKLLSARNLTITGITTNSAFFQWEHDAKHTIHDTQFKLFCRGVRQYLDSGNKLVEESDDFEYAPYASSQGKETFLANSLQPNTKYTCHITTIAEAVESPPTPDVIFNTLYGVPMPPPQPKITVHNNSSFTVHFYHSIEKFGPISHYKVFAVPMKKEADPQSPAVHHFVPTVPSSKLLTQAVLPQLLTKESDPAPFLVGTYTFKELPRSIVFNGEEMRLSFKPNTYYSFVSSVFTKSEMEEMEGLHSFSPPANPPVFISKDLQEDWIQLHQPVAKHFTIIVTCTLVSVTLLFTAAFLSAFASNYYQGKKRDAYYFTINDGDSSEDEIYSKSANLPSSFRPKSSSRSPTVPAENAPLFRTFPTPPPAEVENTEMNQNQAQLVSGDNDKHSSTSRLTDVLITQEEDENPLFNPRRISQTPVTMQHIRDYLVNKSGQPVLSTELGSDSQPQSSQSHSVEVHAPSPSATVDHEQSRQERRADDQQAKKPLQKHSLQSSPAPKSRIPTAKRNSTQRRSKEYTSLKLQDVPAIEQDDYSC